MRADPHGVADYTSPPPAVVGESVRAGQAAHPVGRQLQVQLSLFASVLQGAPARKDGIHININIFVRHHGLVSGTSGVAYRTRFILRAFVACVDTVACYE
jgi:hypothetical protein